MDVENGYFLIKFQSHEDYEKFLTPGPWIVFGHYLMVQPWTLELNPLQAFPNKTTIWVWLLGLLGYFYKLRVLEEIRGLIGKVTKLDFQIEKDSRGKFSRMAMFIDLGKSLISQILVNGVVRRVEFESLLLVCFSCGRFGHMQNSYPSSRPVNDAARGMDLTEKKPSKKEKTVEPTEAFGPLMLVKWKSM
ncbi:uncharacterized protein [Gossypium hirsutum]|uniref:DUF4283 domain-containing protein n=1 Tax=Gossypium hirsutum TaxID=3635 RepID=A0A1U8MX31_GOSHI|nr:uncharacterized protein LOC107942228 [Gossypium hirsutum]